MALAALAIGALGLLLALVLLRAFANAPVARVKQGAAFGAAILGAAVMLGLLVAGRGGQVLWGLVLFGPALWRWWQGRRLARRFGQAGSGDAPASQVRTAMLEMTLDHASGALRGVVLAGPHTGADLATLSPAELRALREECATADPESVPLLEAWLDRAHPDWRDSAPPPNASGAITRAEALAILGLEEGAEPPAIREAHLRLMRAAHPDQGGSDWLAARLNAARDCLLGD